MSRTILLSTVYLMSGGFGMGIVPAQVGAALQAPTSDYHQDPLPLRSDPPREHVPRPIDPNVEHSDTATRLALGEAMTRMEGARIGENQRPKSPLAIEQMKRAGLSDAEIAILSSATMATAQRDATGGIVASGPAGYRPGEVEGLKSTASYWDGVTGTSEPPGRYYAGEQADKARAQMPDAARRKAAADRVKIGLGLRNR
jgi:hypothetical protein